MQWLGIVSPLAAYHTVPLRGLLSHYTFVFFSVLFLSIYIRGYPEALIHSFSFIQVFKPVIIARYTMNWFAMGRGGGGVITFVATSGEAAGVSAVRVCLLLILYQAASHRASGGSFLKNFYEGYARNERTNKQ